MWPDDFWKKSSLGNRTKVPSTPLVAARGGEAWHWNVWRPVYIRLSLQFSLTLACIKRCPELSLIYTGLHTEIIQGKLYFQIKVIDRTVPEGVCNDKIEERVEIERWQSVCRGCSHGSIIYMQLRWRAVSSLESVVATGQHQMRGERRVCLLLGSSRLPCGRRAKSSVEESGQSIRRKRRVSSAIERERTRLLDGHRGRHAWRLCYPTL